MKTRNLWATTLIVALGLTACSDEITSDADMVRINGSINGSINGLATKANIQEYDGTGTFEDGDVWGIYAGVGSTILLSNKAYTVGGSALYWKDLSEIDEVTFGAHYPRIIGTIADYKAFMFNAATAAKPDLLTATAKASKGATVNLNFNHVMHQLAISLSTDLDVPGNVSQTKVTLLNMKSSAKINLLTGVVDASGASGSDAYPSQTGGGTFFVAPQDLTMGTNWIRLELEGKTYTFKVPASLKDGLTNPTRLESGQRVRLMLNLKKSGDVGLTQAISGWMNQVTNVIDGEVPED